MGEDDIVAYVALKDDHPYMAPNRVRFIDDTPISETGKIEKRRLRQLEVRAP
jgi:acyl-coenzyme A synthetase/AMP-(fatty) acid ligase